MTPYMVKEQAIALLLWSNMNNVVNLIIKIYNVKKIDWMGYKLSKNNPYTYHHLIKKCDGGNVNVKNGAILTNDAHEYLNVIEAYDIELYEYINNVLKQINEQGFSPLKRQLLAIDFILKQFEQKYKNQTNSKGKQIIKIKYLDR